MVLNRRLKRSAAGKKPEGKIILHAYHRAGKVRIDIRDDGGGINPAKVTAKAVQSGVITSEQAAAMSDSDVARLIFAAGLSTAEQISDVSGRGVGMDVVKTNIERIGGTGQTLLLRWDQERPFRLPCH